MNSSEKEPETKVVSHTVFKAYIYGALTIQEMVEHRTEYTEEQIKEHLETAYKRLKEAGAF